MPWGFVERVAVGVFVVRGGACAVKMLEVPSCRESRWASFVSFSDSEVGLSILS